MSSLSRELVFLILQFLDEEKFKETVHKWVLAMIMNGVFGALLCWVSWDFWCFLRLPVQAGVGVGILLQHEALRGPHAGRRVGRGGEVPQRLHQAGGQPLLHEDLWDPQAEVPEALDRWPTHHYATLGPLLLSRLFFLLNLLSVYYFYVHNWYKSNSSIT